MQKFPHSWRNCRQSNRLGIVGITVGIVSSCRSAVIATGLHCCYYNQIKERRVRPLLESTCSCCRCVPVRRRCEQYVAPAWWTCVLGFCQVNSSTPHDELRDEHIKIPYSKIPFQGYQRTHMFEVFLQIRSEIMCEIARVIHSPGPTLKLSLSIPLHR